MVAGYDEGIWLYHDLNSAKILSSPEYYLHNINHECSVDPLSSFLNTGATVGTNKALMNLITGLALGPPRAPVHTISEEETESMTQDLQKIGFFDWIK